MLVDGNIVCMSKALSDQPYHDAEFSGIHRYERFAMGQYFQVHNIDNATPVETSMSGKWSENFWASNQDSDFMRALWSVPEGQKRVVVKPYPSGQLAPQKFQLPLPGPPGQYGTRPPFPPSRYPKESSDNLDRDGIFRLSNEIIALIFTYLDDKDDIAFLAMSCQRFFGIASPFLEQAFQKAFVRSWAGDRLICLGDESDIHKLPHDMLTEREVKFLEGEKLRREESIYDYLARLWTLNPDFESHLSMRQNGSRRKDRDFEDYCIISLESYRRSSDVELFQNIVQVDACNPKNKDLYTSNSPYIFRNLVTREYVRGSAVFNLRQEKRYFKWLCFEHLFYLRATWSSDPDLRHGYWGPIELHQGKWAGHRFDLTVIDNLKGKEFRDISDEILEELQDVFAYYS
ncbi:hypothetical protein J132_02523 [Termitomyces sp. J132]|nr:hypothetical protein J132_02523 [Termitomyces sp. J132]